MKKDEPKNVGLDSRGVARLYDLTKPEGSISDRTWRDLSMNAVFARIDQCFTAAGRQMLYRRLRTPSMSEDEDELERFDQRVDAFTKKPTLRDALKKATRPLDVGLADALYGAPIEVRKRLALMVRVGSLSAMVAAAVSLVWPYAVLILALCIVANVALRITLHGTMSLHMASFASVADLITTASAITTTIKMDPNSVSGGASVSDVLRGDLAAGRSSLEAIDAVIPSLRWLTLDVLRLNELTGILITYLNVVFLLDVRAFLETTNVVNKHRPALKRLFEMIGDLDVAQAVAAFRASHQTSKPSFLPRSKGSSLRIEGLKHPLLASSGVANSIELAASHKRGWLIMGSNMSGKSTFLRAVALQAVLAQTIGCVTASRYEAPMVMVRTLMHVEDDLLSGRSHFLVEAVASRDILQAADVADEQQQPMLCVVDELFRGTNTTDRVAASSAFLRALERRGVFVVAATHDSELIPLLTQHFSSHYFQEKIESGTLSFDYIIHEGTATPRNALAVLELVGFPKDVLEEARSQSEET